MVVMSNECETSKELKRVQKLFRLLVYTRSDKPNFEFFILN